MHCMQRANRPVSASPVGTQGKLKHKSCATRVQQVPVGLSLKHGLVHDATCEDGS